MLNNVRRVVSRERKIRKINNLLKNEFQFRDVEFDFEPISSGTGENKNHSVLDDLYNGKAFVIRDLVGKTRTKGILSEILGIEFSSLHEIHKTKKTEDILEDVIKQRAAAKTLALQSYYISLVSNQLGLNKIYCELEPNIRLHLPYSLARKYEKNIEARVGTGQLTAHSVHKDSWYFHPRNTLNLWIALTSVNRKSGMSILENSHDYYPDLNGQDLSNFDDAHSHLHHELNLKPGDGVIFLAELMHGSILNQTDYTRGTVSMRFSTQKPDAQSGVQYWYQRFEQQADQNWKLMRGNLPQLETFNPWQEKATTFSSKKAVKPVKPVEFDGKLIVKEGDNTYTFPKRCPHRGVDLAAGHFCTEEKALICPAHRLFVRGEQSNS
jgi:hypothetical protein